jgi:hypothetical protein
MVRGCEFGDAEESLQAGWELRGPIPPHYCHTLSMSVNGQFEVPARGQLKVPTLRGCC